MADSTPPTKQVFPPVGEDAAPACAHDAVEQLGVDAGQNQYLRCRDCEAVIVAFSATTQWKEQREALSSETGEWNPLIDALRTEHTGPQEDPRREDPHRRESDSLAARVRRTWRRFWAD
jgi:hypothetical protein